jgi:prolyl-tRNA synthetase
VGPVGLRKPARILADSAIQDQRGLITGANENDYHVKGLEWERDIQAEAFADFRSILPGETCTSCGQTLCMVNAIELGHIFKLGTKYSSSMNAVYLDEKGKSRPIVMGSYGIGLERIIAASIEQNRDEKGIIWNPVLAPYLVHIIPIKMDQQDILDTSERLYASCAENGLDALIDDRKVSPGFKFKDADLLGMPIQIILGEKWIREKKLEIKVRKNGQCLFSDEKDCIETVRKLTENQCS